MAPRCWLVNSSMPRASTASGATTPPTVFAKRAGKQRERSQSKHGTTCDNEFHGISPSVVCGPCDFRNKSDSREPFVAENQPPTGSNPATRLGNRPVPMLPGERSVKREPKEVAENGQSFSDPKSAFGQSVVRREGGGIGPRPVEQSGLYRGSRLNWRRLPCRLRFNTRSNASVSCNTAGTDYCNEAWYPRTTLRDHRSVR